MAALVPCRGLLAAVCCSDGSAAGDAHLVAAPSLVRLPAFSGSLRHLVLPYHSCPTARHLSDVIGCFTLLQARQAAPNCAIALVCGPSVS